MAFHGKQWQAWRVTDGNAAIEHLARVFLAGFQTPADMPAKEVWREVEAEFRRLAATLPENDAQAFEAAVRRLIKERLR